MFKTGQAPLVVAMEVYHKSEWAPAEPPYNTGVGVAVSGEFWHWGFNVMRGYTKKQHFAYSDKSRLRLSQLLRVLPLGTEAPIPLERRLAVMMPIGTDRAHVRIYDRASLPPAIQELYGLLFSPPRTALVQEKNR